jgi:hypothetical protein
MLNQEVIKLQDLRDVHKGENIICMGSGPSLLNVPVEFLRSMPTVGINFGPYYSDLLDGFIPQYWVALDTNPMVMLDHLPDEVIKFIPNRQEKRIRANGLRLWNCVFIEIAAMPRPEGTGYSTTMVAAVQLALYLGAPNALVVGFDCTTGQKSDALPEPGKTGTAHFYDPDRGAKYMPGWDSNLGKFAEWAKAMGKGVWNLSNPTMSRYVPKSTYQEWWDEAND